MYQYIIVYSIHSLFYVVVISTPHHLFLVLSRSSHDATVLPGPFAGGEKPCDCSQRLVLRPPPPSVRVASHFVSIALCQLAQAINALAEWAECCLP